jgi:hypothetical protein
LVGTPKWVKVGAKKFKYGRALKIISWSDDGIVFKLPKYGHWFHGTTKTKAVKVKIRVGEVGVKSNKYMLDIHRQ